MYTPDQSLFAGMSNLVPRSRSPILVRWFVGNYAQDIPKGRKRTADDAITALDRLADASLSIVESKKNAAQQAYSVKSCMQILNSMPDLDAKKKLKVAQAFVDVNQRAIFIEMDKETRSLWIEDA
jgi:hypothetical protein